VTPKAIRVAVAAVVAAWLVFAHVAVPSLIAAAYEGRSLPVFNRIIAGQATHPPSHYQDVWAATARRLTAWLAVAAIVGVVVIRRGASSDHARDPAIAQIGRRRLRVVELALAVLIGGSLVDIVVDVDVEHWPFSPYPMYATVARPGPLTVTRLMGVVEGTGREIPLTSDADIRPFDRSRLAAALRRLAVRGDSARLNRALLDCLTRYERRRGAGDHHGPPLAAVRLYELTWTLDPRAANVDTPTGKRLIAAVSRGAPEAAAR
jgi:hypothetical protein